MLVRQQEQVVGVGLWISDSDETHCNMKECKWQNQAGTLAGRYDDWDYRVYAMNMFYYHWLFKKMLWAIDQQNIARQEI